MLKYDVHKTAAKAPWSTTYNDSKMDDFNCVLDVAIF